jgi:PAS domain S-box-containing protein
MVEPHAAQSSTSSLLVFSFISVGALMILGGAIALLELDFIRARAQYLYQADEPARAALRVQSDFLSFQRELESLSNTKNAARFAEDGNRLLLAFETDVEHATQALRALPGGTQRDSELITLETVRTLFAGQIKSLVALAKSGDWVAVRARFEKQMPVIMEFAESVAHDVDGIVEIEKERGLEDIRHAQAQATWTLVVSGLLVLMTAALLGLRVTRSIAGRLEKLDGAARALARGDFAHRVVVGGDDEIASLSQVFNKMGSELQKVYATLRVSESHFRSLIENATDFILVVNADGTVRYVSPSMERDFAQSGSLVGNTLVALVHPEDAEVVKTSLAGAAQHDTSGEWLEFRLRHADGSVRMLEAQLNNLLRNPAVAGIVFNARDITKRRQMEEQLSRARIMEAMGSLVAGVAHGVRNPLFSISATVDALEAELGQRPDFAEFATQLRFQVGRLTQLMQDLLDFGKPALLRRAPTYLPAVLRRGVHLSAALAQNRQVAVEEQVADDLPTLEIDAARLEEALENLVANAIQHAPPGSVVRVSAGLQDDGGRRFVRFTVEDAGPGLPEGNVAQIFEPFFSRRKGGTGLGLSIVQRVVEAHGGSVTAENREGEGARFTLLLPFDGRPGQSQPCLVET